MSIVEYAYALRKRWLAIALLAILGAAGGYLSAYLSPDLYRSTGSVMIGSDRGDSTSELTQGSTFVQGTIPTYVVMATSDVVLDPVIRELDLDTTSAQLAALVSASTPLGTTIIEVSVSHGDPERAQEIAAAVLDSLGAVIPEVSPHSAEGKPSVTVTTIQQPNVPRFPYSPNTRLSTALGGLIGLVAGVVYALARRLFGDHISSPRDVEQLTEAPVLGQVLESKRGTTLPEVVLRDPLSPEAESVRALAANLNFLRIDGGLRSLVITSSDQGEGKSTIAIALGLVVAESAKRVLIIDADLRRPSVARVTGLEDGVGLTGVLLGDIALPEALEDWGVPGLYVLTSGPTPPNPSQLVSSDAMKELITTSESEFDLVIIDTGPTLSVSDAIWLSHATGGALVVARWGRTSRHHLSRALTALERAESRILGVVLTRNPRRGSSRYEYAAPAAPAGEKPLPSAAPVDEAPEAPQRSKRSVARRFGLPPSEGASATDT